MLRIETALHSVDLHLFAIAKQHSIVFNHLLFVYLLLVHYTQMVIYTHSSYPYVHNSKRCCRYDLLPPNLLFRLRTVNNCNFLYMIHPRSHSQYSLLPQPFIHQHTYPTHLHSFFFRFSLPTTKRPPSTTTTSSISTPTS